MRIGLLITTFNRPEYLTHCLESVSKIEFDSDLTVLVIDDNSSDSKTLELIDQFQSDKFEIRKMYLPKNKGIANALRIGFNYLFASGCELVTNLDGDAIVKPEFLSVLTALKSRFPDCIVSGFNTQSADPKTGIIRHQTIGQFQDYCLKQTVGGINMMISDVQYKAFVLPALLQTGHWDWNVCKRVKSFIVSTPSVVQHIGIGQGMNLNNPDIAFDF